MTIHEYRKTADLHPDPANAAIFDAMAGDDLQELADSIREHGLINPLSVRPDGRLIAGEQRWRAAQLAGLETVPVIVHDVTDQEAEALRIEENLRRRTFRPSETARAIRRLHELADIHWGGDRSKVTQGNFAPTATEEIAGQIGYNPKVVSRLNTLADLIPPLAALLDAKHITQKVAYQLAQLPAEDQEAIAALPVAALQSEPEAKALKAQLQERTREIDILISDGDVLRSQLAKAQAHPGTAPASGRDAAVQESLKRRISELEQDATRLRTKSREDTARLLQEKADAVAAVEQKHSFAERWQKDDEIHKTLERLNRLTRRDATEAASSVGGVLAIRTFLELDRETAEAGIVWLREYADVLGVMLNKPPTAQTAPATLAEITPMRRRK